MRILIVCYLIFISMVCSAQQRSRPDYEPFSNLTEAKSYLLDQESKGVFSGTVLVVVEDETHLLQAYGYANKTSKSKNKLETRINIGSINKAFTAVCVLKLIEEGKLELDDNIIQFIPELSMQMGNEITIRHLLQMKSGLGSYFSHPEYQARRHELSEMEDYLVFIQGEELRFQPGTERQYSNSGYELLGILIERVSGVNYYDFVKKVVYDKAGMHNTGTFNRYKSQANQARGYTRYKEGQIFGTIPEGGQQAYINDAAKRHAVKGTAAGGGYSTVEDLYRFVTSMEENRLLSAPYTDLFFNRYEEKTNRRNFYRAGGGSIGINAQMIADFSRNYIVIVLANYDPPTASNVAGRLSKTIEKGIAQDQDSVAIEQVVEKFKQTIKTEEKEAFMKLFVQEKISWVGNGSKGPLWSSPEEFMNFLANVGDCREDFHNLEIWNDEFIGIVTFDYGFFESDRLMNWGKESWMLIKEKGEWKITSVNFSMIMPFTKPYPFAEEQDRN